MGALVGAKEYGSILQIALVRQFFQIGFQLTSRRLFNLRTFLAREFWQLRRFCLRRSRDGVFPNRWLTGRHTAPASFSRPVDLLGQKHCGRARYRIKLTRQPASAWVRLSPCVYKPPGRTFLVGRNRTPVFRPEGKGGCDSAMRIALRGSVSRIQDIANRVLLPNRWRYRIRIARKIGAAIFRCDIETP